MGPVSEKSGTRGSYAAKRVRIYRLRLLYFPVCFVGLLLLVLSFVKLSVEISIDGEVIGYVSLREHPRAVVEAVERDAAYVLGESWKAPEPEYRPALRKAAPETLSLLKSRLYSMVDGAAWMELVYVDGNAVCAFETQKEAAEALRCVTELYSSGATVSTGILERISIGRSFSRTDMLEDAVRKLIQSLTVETREEKTATRALPFTVEVVERDDWYEDQWKLVTTGEEGLEETHYSVTNRNGSIVGSAVLSDETVKEPVAQVIWRGTRHHYSTGSYIWPVEEGRITSRFGVRHIELGSTYHKGIDIAAPQGTEIRAADGGEVVFAGMVSGYGNLVTLRHENGDMTRYAHNSRLLVSEGDMVEQGQVIAEMGSTGVSSGSHLHFEILPEGKNQVNPLTKLPEEIPEGIRVK